LPDFKKLRDFVELNLKISGHLEGKQVWTALHRDGYRVIIK
jgi:hypothetical protein